jgi:glucose/mannose-6-phosphate isomerase
MVDLDDPALLRRQDPGGMGRLIAELPEAVASAWQAALAFQLPAEFRSVNSVVIAGMGGSSIGGDLVRSLAEAESPAPVVVQRGYDLPGFAGKDTLVIAVSHSGGTEETLSQAAEAASRGCKLLALTSGGALPGKVKSAGGTVFAFSYPAQPRAALAYLFVPLVAFFGQLGFLRDRSSEVEEAVQVLRQLQAELAAETPASNNMAKRLAQAIEGRAPVVYGGGMMAEVAHRWKTQFNENSKAWAAYEQFPELNHNAVVGYERPTTFLDHVVVLLLETSHEHPRVAVRERVTEALLDMGGVRHLRIPAHGRGAIAQMLSAILIGDYVSYYLAQLYQVDPTPIAAIDHLKGELARAAA